MQPGQESRTSVFVCMGRAYAHGNTSVSSFSDPTALALLPADARQRVERARSKTRPRSFRERVGRLLLSRRAQVMVARTVAIDEAIREAKAPQLVILGAGLDGRAWRMAELRDATVFEIDHPDTQRAKRERATALTPAARDIRFVPVDFTRDSLDDALARAGHDPARPTTWLWEGVVMYLPREAIEATLAVVARRSAPRSRIVILYHAPSPVLLIAGALVRRVGEPLRSRFTAGEMRSLLARFGFTAVRDDSIAELGRGLARDVARASRVAHHLRLVTADRK